MMRAALQVALAAAFLSFLVPQQAGELRAVRRQLRDLNPIERLLAHRDPVVRAAACELVAWRGEVAEIARLTRLATSDKHESVRLACREAVQSLQRREDAPLPIEP